MYEYKAISIETGEIIEGKISEHSLTEFKNKLKREGYYLTSLNKLNIFEKYIHRKQILKPKKLFKISNYFTILLKAGIPILEILKLLKDRMKRQSDIKMIDSIIKEVKNGEMLSIAFMNTGKFPNFYINNLKVGEETGNLDSIFDDLSEYYFLEYSFTNKIKKALYYPLILFTLMIIIFISFFRFILPNFTSVFKEFNIELPKSTKILLKVNNILNVTNIIIVISIMLIVKIILNKSPKYLNKKGKLKLKVPLLGKIYRLKINIEVSKALRIQMNSGVSLKRAIKNINLIYEEPYIKKWLKEVLESLQLGNSLHNSLSLKEIMLEESLYMIMIGEKTGHLEKSFLEIEKISTITLNEKLETITKLIEPITLIIISFFIGILLIGVLTPIFNLSNNLML